MPYFADLPRVVRKEITWINHPESVVTDDTLEATASPGKSGYIPEDILKPSEEQRSYWPIFTAGAGLFSDGYVANSIGVAATCFKKIYGADKVTGSKAMSNVASIAFVGTVVGQLSFGFVSDYVSRKVGMLVSSGGLIIFAILCAGAWGVGTEAKYGGNPGGVFAALAAYRFFLGVFIGAEYPTGSAACAEASALLPAGHRNRYFSWFTNTMIDLGFVVAAFVPMVCLWIFKPHNLQPVWRITLGLGAIPPLSLFLLRLKFKEGEQFRKTNFKHVKVPWGLVFKYYWFRLFIVMLIWWIYDFSAYAFGIYSTTILDIIIPDGDLYKTFGWNVVFNLFYMPGAFAGALVADYIGPRLTLVTGVLLQAIFGFAMAGALPTLKEHVAGFTVFYGIFMTFGEFGPGDNIGLLASKTCATPVRGVYYSIAAAFGKIGAFCGTWAFPAFQANYKGDMGLQAPFYLASSLAIVSAGLALFFLPPVDQEAMQREDVDFLNYLQDNGFDISQLGDGLLREALKEKEIVHEDFEPSKASD
ncbi:hypothetical protein OGAPHI_007280 [Ogataea philodendri]|uniref:Major facilitator superfamily (MFS) profile domain-containing protein n=1 Tax=Ogataea philodendri TaxID=1378263 RepID=A0A9P8NUR5_9ASCO|nr:uncharacterized protein OGAPHI_007280 [Ogataea philodendri]KAH3660075.1 hypothetical protein OGAPHI_007280 [Ogataea philodendri]